MDLTLRPWVAGIALGVLLAGCRVLGAGVIDASANQPVSGSLEETLALQGGRDLPRVVDLPEPVRHVPESRGRF